MNQIERNRFVFYNSKIKADIPESVLGQLGLKIQHALRAFTAKDRKAIKMAAENYPITEYYDVDQLITTNLVSVKLL